VLLELGSYTAENLLLGENIAKERMSGHIERMESFMIESNLSKKADYEWIERMQRHGYDTVLYFLGTDNVEINKDRVLNRVAQGGHDVAVPLIEQRHRMGLTYLKSEVLNFTEAYLYDSSDRVPEQMAVLKKGKIIEQANEPELWVKETLFIAERLQQKQQQIAQTHDTKTQDRELLKKLKNTSKNKRGGHHL
jgi:predicted ABC-type ATPase